MKPILYYGRPVEREFFKGKGWRGWLVLRMHWLWCKLGRWIEWHILILLVSRHLNLDEDVVKAVKERFHEEDAEELDGRTRRRSALAAFGVPGAQFTPQEVRYREGRKNGPTREEFEERGREEVDQTITSIARLMQGKNRTMPYTVGRDIYFSQEVDADEPTIEAVPPINGVSRHE